MPEYHVTFRKVLAAGGADVEAQVSDDDEILVQAIETIRSRIVDYSRDVKGALDALPNGHFMEIEFIVDDESVHGVVFLTPYLPDTFVAILRSALAGTGIDAVV